MKGPTVTTSHETLIAEVLERNSSKFEHSVTAEDQSEPPRSDSDRQALARSLIESTQNVFSTMCGIDLTVSPDASVDGSIAAFQISGIIGLSGNVKATIVMSIGNDLLFHAAEQIIGIQPSKIDADVTDLVGELANMIGGNAKERLNRGNLSLGLPTVVSGENHRVAYSSEMRISCIPFTSPYGRLSIELGMA